MESNSQEASMADVLYFWTGSATIPPGGFQDGLELQYLSDTDQSLLPRANVCFNLLKIPVVHSSEKDFFKFFNQGIMCSLGHFGLL